VTSIQGIRADDIFVLHHVLSQYNYFHYNFDFFQPQEYFKIGKYFQFKGIHLGKRLNFSFFWFVSSLLFGGVSIYYEIRRKNLSIFVVKENVS